MAYRIEPPRYAILKPPFSLEWSEMSKQELLDHFAWFIDVLPERIAELEAEVQRTPATATWRADFTPSSFDSLGAWFVGHVETRPRSAEELADIEAGLTIPVKVAAEELTEKTYSLASDIGMYLGASLRTHRPELKWDLRLDSKSFVDYGRPVLAGFAKGKTMNPVSIAVTLAQGIMRKNRGPERLRQLFDVWSKSP